MREILVALLQLYKPWDEYHALGQGYCDGIINRQEYKNLQFFIAYAPDDYLEMLRLCST